MKLVSLLVCRVDITGTARTLFPTPVVPKTTPQVSGMGNLLNSRFLAPPLDNLIVLEMGH